jgi:hypothetical protein
MAFAAARMIKDKKELDLKKKSQALTPSSGSLLFTNFEILLRRFTTHLLNYAFHAYRSLSRTDLRLPGLLFELFFKTCISDVSKLKVYAFINIRQTYTKLYLKVILHVVLLYLRVHTEIMRYRFKATVHREEAG